MNTEPTLAGMDPPRPIPCPFADEFGCDPSVPERIRVVVLKTSFPEEHGNVDGSSFAFPVELCEERDAWRWACGCRWWGDELP